jgi:hypothetical protein
MQVRVAFGGNPVFRQQTDDFLARQVLRDGRIPFASALERLPAVPSSWPGARWRAP